MGSSETAGNRVTRRRAIGLAMAIALGVLSATIARAPAAVAQTAAGVPQFTVDSAASTALTDYFKHNRLPLVGAQVGRDTAGDRRVVLYGYVATQLGQSDAERKATAFLGAPAPQIVNRIVIQPELANAPQGGAVGSAGEYGGEAAASGASFDSVMNAIARYGVKPPPDAANPNTAASTP